MCGAISRVETRVGVHVLIHRHEQCKPSSTGSLIVRAVADARCHVYQRESPFFRRSGFAPASVSSERPLWILHPGGEPLPSAAGPAAALSRPQVLLIDGTWRQAGEMLRTVEGMGRVVRLPEQEQEQERSRYWLREHATPTHVSTAEALIRVFRAVGDPASEHRLRLHFELHVYAMLLARGRREMAERYLGHSPLLVEVPEVLERLHQRRLPLPDRRQ